MNEVWDGSGRSGTWVMWPRCPLCCGRGWPRRITRPPPTGSWPSSGPPAAASCPAPRGARADGCLRERGFQHPEVGLCMGSNKSEGVDSSLPHVPQRSGWLDPPPPLSLVPHASRADGFVGEKWQTYPILGLVSFNIRKNMIAL